MTMITTAAQITQTLDTEQESKSWSRLTTLEETQIIDLRTKNYSIGAIAKITKRSRWAINRVLTEAGTPQPERTVWQQRRHEQHIALQNRAIELRRQKLSYRAIAARLNIANSVASRLVKDVTV